MSVIQAGSIDDLSAAAEIIMEALGDHSVVAFYGNMGAGKTTLIRELAAQLGVADNVTSPTFALINRYRRPDGSMINHFDFYRIDRIEEAFDLGYEEYFYSDDLNLIEWPEKIEELLPEHTLRVTIEVANDENRTITIDDNL